MTKEQKNIIILGVQVPFTRGGAELLVEKLCSEIRLRGHTADIVQLPFSAIPKANVAKEIVRWRALDLTEFAGRKVDVVIPTKFPSYMVQHPNKNLWLIHQFRQLYELYGTRFGDFEVNPEDEALRLLVLEADRIGLSECRVRYTISENVSNRLKTFLDLSSEVLIPPLPFGNDYKKAPPYVGPGESPYILSVGRLCSIKRVDLIIRAIAEIDQSIELKIVGGADEPQIETYLKSEVEKHHLWNRVSFLGRVENDALLDLIAKSFLVYYAPFDEDFGFVALEALSSGVPLITAKDSGTVCSFVENEVNGLIVDPNEQAIAAGCSRLFKDVPLMQKLRSGAEKTQIDSSWDKVVGELVESSN